ncbi:MAG: hypothetical protein JW915_14630 [Chitinispirillaceae bacterium]|nr:hypothetical protein [Chitinispirillaceae bacterium]MBN2769746.1 hypothetical protein [Spirochaetota bacterium]
MKFYNISNNNTAYSPSELGFTLSCLLIKKVTRQLKNCLCIILTAAFVFGAVSCSQGSGSGKSPEAYGELSAKAVSAGMIRLDFYYENGGHRIFGIFRSSEGNEPEYVTALQPTYTIFHDRDLTPGVEYTYTLYAYVDDEPIFIGEASAIPESVPENAHYIRSDATGANNGSSWENAWTEVPDSLERGHTYFIADGNYQKVIFDVDEEDSKFIFLKKATPENHGSDAGWDNSYGDGQAVFQAEDGMILTFRNGFYDFDGQTGSGIAGHGFKTKALSDALTYSILADSTYKDDDEINSYINVYRTEMQLAGCERIPDVTGSGRGFQVRGVLSHSILSHVYIHDLPGIPIYYVNNSFDNIIEYSHVARNHSDSVSHAEAIQTHTGAEFNIVRYSYWEDIEGSSVLRLKNDWDVYGNIIYNSSNYPSYGQNGSGVSQGAVSGTGNLRFYNNTTVDIQYGYNAGYYNTGDGNEVYNNLWVNCSRIRFSDATGEPETKTDYNGLFKSDDNGNHTEEHLQIFTSNPIDSNFRPLFETKTGIELPFPYNIDMDGNMRGEDGIWTRGAFEYVGD